MDKFCQKALGKHWPGVPIVEDVRDVDTILAYAKCNGLPTSTDGNQRNKKPNGRSEKQAGSKQFKRGNYGPEIQHPNVDLLTGGFPCQPFSVAGKQRSKKDDRYLWPQTLAVIAATRPRFILLENVAGIVKLALDTVLSDLEAEGYTTGTVIIPACAKNAPHRRDRVWIVAHTGRFRRGRRGDGDDTREDGSLQAEGSCPTEKQAYVADSIKQGLERRNRPENVELQGEEEPMRSVRESNILPCQFCGYEFDHELLGKYGCPNCEGEFERRLGGATDGLSQRLDYPWGPGWEDGTPRIITGQKDRVNRLKSLGNSIVPQIAAEIMNAIKLVDGR